MVSPTTMINPAGRARAHTHTHTLLKKLGTDSPKALLAHSPSATFGMVGICACKVSNEDSSVLKICLHKVESSRVIAASPMFDLVQRG